MTGNKKDAEVVRALAEKYAEIAAKPVQEERRVLWRDLNSLKPTRPLVLATYGMWNVWCREVFGDDTLVCEDPACREYERYLRMLVFQDEVGDDFIVEPWITLRAAMRRASPGMWGVPYAHAAPQEGGSWKFDPPLKDWADMAKLTPPVHAVDEAKTAHDAERFRDIVGDLVEVDIDRRPLCQNFQGDISYDVAQMRGLEQLMVDMYESPEDLHELLAFLRDGILANQAQAEAAGDYSLTSQQNQAMTYAGELEAPRANSGPRKRKDLWGFLAAQEFTLISPEMHEEFLLRYQAPIAANFGLVHYGCCENLTRKIDMLRKIPNLRSIAVTPTADVARCAEQIGTDYVISWRPNPTDMVCCGFDENRIRRIIREGLECMRGYHVNIHLKDVETVEGETDRLSRWVRIVREVIEECYP